MPVAPGGPLRTRAKQVRRHAKWVSRASSSTARSSPGSSPSSSCWRAASPPCSLPIEQYPDHRPARGGDQRRLSRRRRPDAAELRHPGDRAAAHRPRQSALLLVRLQRRTARWRITATFAPGTNPDIAQVQVQNKVQAAVPLLPSAGAAAGRAPWPRTSPTSSSSSASMTIPAATTMSTSPTSSPARMHDPISRVPGVGNTQVFGAQYAMRIWLDPFKLKNFSADAVRRQRRDRRPRTPRFPPARSASSPPCQGQQLNATVTAQSRLQTPEQFRNIILKTSPGGARGAAARCRPRRAGRGNLRHRQPVQRPSRRRYRRHAGAGRQRAEDRGRGQGNAPRNCAPSCRRA